MKTRLRFSILVGLLLSAIFASVRCDDDDIEKESQSPYPMAEEHNMDGQKLAQAFSALRQLPAMKALLVGRDGTIVAEEYYGIEPAAPQEVRSVTKSVVSLLIGIAVDRGYIASIDQPISDYLESVDVELTTVQQTITIRHLLTMSGGFAWTEFGDWSEYDNWVTAPNQVRYLLSKPQAWPPGAHFNYNDGACHLLSVILTEATGLSTLEFANRFLFEPLSISGVQWKIDNQGYFRGCTGLSLTARDMFKIGELVRLRGVYRGARVVSEEWISRSTSAQISTGGVMSMGSEYGFLWWVDSLNGHATCMATGYGGQFIFLVSDWNLIVTAQCGSVSSQEVADQNWWTIMQTILNQIVPSVKDRG